MGGVCANEADKGFEEWVEGFAEKSKESSVFEGVWGARRASVGADIVSWARWTAPPQDVGVMLVVRDNGD